MDSQCIEDSMISMPVWQRLMMFSVGDTSMRSSKQTAGVCVCESSSMSMGNLTDPAFRCMCCHMTGNLFKTV